MITICHQCNSSFEIKKQYFNRAKKINAPLFCCKKCFNESRRKYLTIEEKKLIKAKYDKQYRINNSERIKENKAKYFKKTYDPIKAAIERKKNMQRHIEYCRSPQYKLYKSGYDRKYRAKKIFNDFYESFLLLQDIEREIDSRATRYDIYQQNGLLNKAQQRRRLL